MPDQFQTLVDALPEILSALEAKGVHIKMPKFDGRAGGGANDDMKETEDLEEEDDDDE